MTDTFDYGAAAGKKDEQQDVPVFTPDISTPDPKPVATSFDFEAAAGRRTKPPAVEDGKPLREITDPRGGPRVNQPEPPQWSAFGTPLPGTKAAEQGAEIHPLSRAVLQNFDLTDDISGNSAALRKIVRRVDEKSNPRSRLPVDELTVEQLTKIVEQPRMQRALQLDSITRRRMAEDAEEAAILRGEIPFMLAAEGSVDTMVRMMRPPETRTPEAIAAQQNRGVVAGVINPFMKSVVDITQGLRRAQAIGTQGLAEAARTNAWDTFVDEFSYHAKPDKGMVSANYLTWVWSPLDVVWGIGAAVGKVADVYIEGGYNEETAQNLEAKAAATFQDTAAILRKAAANYPSGLRDAAFAKKVADAESDFAIARLLFEDPAGFASFSAAVFAQNVPVLAATAVASVTAGPRAAYTVNTIGQYAMEYARPDPQRAEYLKKKTGIDINTPLGMNLFLKDVNARRIYTTYGKERAASIATAQALTFGYLRGGTFFKPKSLTARLAEVSLVGGALEGVGEGLAGYRATGELDVREAFVESVVGTASGTTIIEGALTGWEDGKRLNDSKKAKAWLKGSTEIKGDIAGIPVVKLDTAASVMGEKLESEGIETVYITASDLYKFDQDGEVAETLGLNPEDVARAAAEGGTVEVSASTFVRHILGKDGFDALLEHTMFDPTGMTPAEARQYDEAGIGDQIQQQIEERVRSNLAPGLDESSLSKLNTDMSTIQDQVAGQLEATGRYDANKSRLFGLLTAQRYATRAIRIAEETGQPVDASALFASDNLQIQGGPGSAVQVSAELGGPQREPVPEGQVAVFDVEGNQQNVEVIERSDAGAVLVRGPDGEEFVLGNDLVEQDPLSPDFVIDILEGSPTLGSLSDDQLTALIEQMQNRLRRIVEAGDTETGSNALPDAKRFITAARAERQRRAGGLTEAGASRFGPLEQGRLRDVWDTIRGKDSSSSVVTLRHGGPVLEGGKLDLEFTGRDNDPTSTSPRETTGIYFSTEGKDQATQFARGGRSYEARLPAESLSGVVDFMSRVSDLSPEMQQTLSDLAAEAGIEVGRGESAGNLISRIRSELENGTERLVEAGISGHEKKSIDEMVIWDQALLDSAELFDVTEGDPVQLRQDGVGQRAVSSPDALPPQSYTLTTADKKRIKELKAKVPGLGRLIPLLQPDEQALLTETSAKNFVELYHKMPSPQEMAEVALSGSAKRGWYVNSGRALVEIFGEDAPRFAALLAALSPQTSVESNTTNALSVWRAWIAADRPTDPNQIIRIMGAHVQGDKGEGSVLDAWRNNTVNALTSTNPATITISGPKVNSFMLNLLGFFNEVTNDAWMANYAGVAQGLFAKNQAAPGSGKGAGYLALSARARKAAQVLSKKTGEEWTGSEIQETVWSWAKALYEKADAQGETRTALKILQDGDLTHEEINAVPDFEQLFIKGEYRQLLEDAGYSEQLKVVDAAVEERLASSTPPTGSVYEGANTDLHRAAKRLGALADARAAAKVRAEIQVTLSATTGTIRGLNALHEAVQEGDPAATVLLQEVARDALTYLTSKIKSIEIEYTPAVGLYAGDAEPSMGLSVSFQERDRTAALAALAKFAENFNQEQVHVRGDVEPRTKVGHVYPDGSYNTDVAVFTLTKPLSRSDTESIINGSGLFGMTVSDTELTAYYVGDPNDKAAIEEFNASIGRADKLLGDAATQLEGSTARLWAYGNGEGATNGYGEIQREFRPPTQDQAVATAQRVASRLAEREVQGTEQADVITEDQQALQERIAEAYEALPLNDLDNPDVRRAYEELATEVLEQYDALPIKVEIFDGKGEPYTKGKAVSSAKMRQDILHNNHLFIFGTDAGGFGPEGVVYDNHPMLGDSGRTDENGKPMLFNDLFRAVHDYYAHTITASTFGPRGEEAAWATHMEMTKSPWARWALTSETRGQNSWVNFRKEVQGTPLRERGFGEQKVALLPLEFLMTGKPDVDAALSELPGSEGLPLEQTDPAAFEQQRGAAGPRGAFTPSDLITDQDGKPVNLIQIFEKADPTTFLHESGHFWLEQLKADALAVGGGLQQDFKTVTDWWASRPLELREEAVKRAKKAKDKDSVAALQQMTEAQVSAYARSGELRGEGPSRYLSVAMHEQFARGVENYFATGRAPSLSLAGVFSAFKVWVGSVYAKLAGAKLDVQFSAEVTAVIDRMLAADEEIALIEGQYNLAAMYTTAEQAGMTPTQFAAYQKKIAEAKDDRRARQLAKHIKELKRERTAWWNDERETLRGETEQEVAAEPAYRLLYALTNQGLADGSTLPEGEALDRMDRELLKEILEAEGFSLDDIPRIDSKAVYEADGLSPGVVAQTFGYDDVDAMILDLVGRQPYAQAVDEAIDAKMEEEHGSIESSGEIEALASAYSERTAQVLAAELAALRTTEPAFKQAFVRAYARDRLLELPSAQIRPYRFLAAEKRHANMAGDALKRGDRVAAYQHQFQRLVNHYMATEALKAQRDIEKKTRYLKAFTKRGKKFPTIEADYVDNILRILAAVNFGQGAAGQQSRFNEIVALQAFIEEKQAADGSLLDVPAWLTDTTGSVANSTREISYLQFLQLHETIKRYEQQGRTANKIRRGDEELSLAEGKASLLSVLDGMNKSRVQRLRGKTASARGVSYTVASVIALADAQLLKVEALLEAIDGKIMGPWHQTIYEPFNQAAADKYRLQEEVSQVIGELISNLPKDVRRGFGKRVDVGALGTPGMTFTRGELIMMALNVGNESNLDKFIRGMGGDPKTNVKGAGWNINEELIDAALDNLTEEEWSLVRGVWEHAEKLYPTVEGIYRREHGISPDRVEPRTVKTKFGEFKGGYFPMMYDRSIAGVAVDLQQKTALQLMQAETGRASINSSMTKARTGYAAPVDLDISRLALGLDNTIHFITHYEAVRNANKILGDRDIRSELETKVGIAYTEQLTKWVAALASNGNDSPPVDIFQLGIQKLYNNTTIGVLGFSYSTLGMQTLGLFNGQDRLLADSGYGPAGIAVLQKDMAEGVAAAFRPSHIEFVIQASGEMQGRRKSMDREVSQVLRNLAGKDGVVTGAQRFSMQAIAEVQFYTVDIPVWTAAYNRAQRGIVPGVNTGDTDAAIKYADRVVRMSQSAGGLKDLAAIQRHKGLIKGLTMFYSFFSALYFVLRSVGVEFTQNAKEKPIAATGRAATRVFVLLALQSVATGLIRGDLPDWDEEDEKKKGMLEYLAKESVSTALGTIPVVREIAAGWANGYGYSGGAGTIAFDSMTKALGGMEKFINELGEEETVKSDGDYEDLARRAAPYVLLIGAARGIPAVQANRTLDGLGAMYDEADNWYWSDLLRGYNAERAKRREN